MFKDGQAIIIQIGMLNCEKQLPNNCLKSFGNIQILAIVSEFDAAGEFYSLQTITILFHRTASILMLSQATI